MDLPDINGYVLALYDANGGNVCSWGPAGRKVDFEDVGLNIKMVRNKENKGFYGYKNTKAIIGLCDTYTDLELKHFPAAKHAYERLTAPDPLSSDWFLPSIGQVQYWHKYRYVILSSVRKATGDSEYKWKNTYWSSSESEANPENLAKSMDFDLGTITVGNKSIGRYVRACLAFGKP